MKTPKKSSTSNSGRRFCPASLTLAAALVMPATTGLAQTLWQGGTSDYNNPASWNGIYNDPSNPNCSNDSGSNNVVLIQPGDPIWQHGDTLAGNASGTSGAYLQTGSTNNTGGGNWLRMGLTSGSFGSYVLSNGVVNVGGQTHLGEAGVGYLEIDGGTYNGNVNDGGADPAMCAGAGDWNGGGGTGTLVVNGGTVNMPQETWFGEGGGTIGNFFMNGGTYNSGNWFVFGRHGSIGNGTMTGGTVNANGGNVLIGTDGGNGLLAQSGGIFNSHVPYLVPNNGGPGSGTNILSGTAVLNVYSWLAVGRAGGYGEMDISGSATVTHSDGGSHIDIGAGGGGGGGGNGLLNQNGGTITDGSSDFWMGESADATWNLNSGSAYLLNVVMSVGSGINSTLNLNGGLLQATSIESSQPLSISTLNLNGGTLQANADNLAFINGIFQASVGGSVVIDSQGYNITIPQSLQDNGGGSVTKIGTGVLTLTGANTYTGTTAVQQGTLEIPTSSTIGGAVVVSDTASFGTSVASLNGQLVVPSLTAGGATGCSLNFNLGGFGVPTSAPLNVSGAFTANGVITVNVTASPSSLTVGNIPLLQYGSVGGTHTYVLGSVPTGVAANLVTAGNTLELQVTSYVLPRWNGNVTGAWDLGTNQDWYDLITLQPTVYLDGKPIIFDDTATGTTTVSLTATVSPGSVNFNNSSLSYSLVGAGKISGATGINVNGPGSVAIQNTGGNNFTGPVTIINGGSLSVNSVGAIGASSSSPTNLVLDNATFSYSGAPATANRGFTVAGTNSTINTAGDITFSGTVASQGNGVEGGSGLVKTGPAQLAFTTVGINQFGNTFNPGSQVQQGTLLLDGSAGGQTNHNANEMWIGCTPTSGGSMILSNTTLNVDNWVGLGRINGGINNTSTITLYNSTLNSGNLSIGWDGGQPGNLASQFLTLNGSSTFADHGDMNLSEGTGSSATIRIGGTSLLSSQNRCFLALAASSTGAVTIASSGHMSVGGWFSIAAGQASLGSVLVQDAGSLTVSGDLNVCDGGSGATGSLTVQGNATATGNTVQVGKGPGCNGTLTISGSGASVNASGSYMTSATGNSATIATINIGDASQPGGSLNGHDDFTIGQDGTAVVNMVTNGGGTLTVPNTIYLSRGSAVADGIVNLNAGSTIVAGYVNNGWGFQNNLPPTGNPNAFNFNGGTLKSYGGANPSYPFIQPFVNVVVQAGGAVIDDNGAARYISAPLVDGGGGGGLTKVGAGALALLGVNTYTGTTLVSTGALAVGPGGVIAGPVNVASGATLAGDTGSIGTFNINNTLTLSNGCQVFMQITDVSNDQIAGLTSVSYGGSLVVSNSSANPLTVGHQYPLFNAALAGSGHFSSVTILSAVGGPYTGSFNAATGVLTITSAGAPTINTTTLSGGNLTVTGSGGTPGTGYTWLANTNLAAPIATWTTNTTGIFSVSGTFTNTFAATNPPAQFFRLRTP